MYELDSVLEYAVKFKAIYIYGAGRYGKLTLEYLNREKICVKGFLVSDVSKNPDECNGLRVYNANKILPMEDEAIIVAISKISFDMKQSLMNQFKKNIMFLNKNHINALAVMEKELIMSFCNSRNIDYELMWNSKSIDPSAFLYIDKKSKKPLFRVYGVLNNDNLQEVDEYCNVLNFEKSYGKLHMISDLGNEKKIQKTFCVEMYVATSHLDNFDIRGIKRDKIRKAIQVGTGMTDIRKGCLTDNTGDNISKKNREYCECTGLYWIWKNTGHQDYVGLEHYRRRMDINEEMLRKIYANEIDMLLPIPQFQVTRNVDFIYKSLVTQFDWNKVVEIIIGFDPNYKGVIEKYENSFFYFSCNIGLLKREIFDKYCEFAFYVANKLEEFYKEKNIYRDCDRFMGFIFEHLFSLFIMKNYDKLNICCTNLLWVN